jgi:cytochrome c peroxidase
MSPSCSVISENDNFQHSGDGADGSIITFAETETCYPANGGIDDIIKKQRLFIEKWGMTAGDL